MSQSTATSPRAKWLWRLYVATLVAVGAATLLAEVGMHGAHAHAPVPLAASTTCPAVKATINVAVTNTAVGAHPIAAHLCDQLIFTNQTNHSVEVAFGPHDQHILYPGLSDASIGPAQKRILTLTATGTFPMHDHDNDAAQGRLTVMP